MANAGNSNKGGEWEHIWLTRNIHLKLFYKVDKVRLIYFVQIYSAIGNFLQVVLC